MQNEDFGPLSFKVVTVCALPLQYKKLYVLRSFEIKNKKFNSKKIVIVFLITVSLIFDLWLKAEFLIEVRSLWCREGGGVKFLYF